MLQDCVVPANFVILAPNIKLPAKLVSKSVEF